MKSLFLSISMVCLLSIACQQEEAFNPQASERFDADTLLLPDHTALRDVDGSALIIDGVPYYTGIGYSPTQDRLFAPAIDPYDMFQSTSLPKPLEIDVQLVKTNEELENYMKRTVSRSSGGLLSKIFGFGGKSKRVIEQSIKVSENNLTVIARISVQRFRYVTDGDPFLSSTAQGLVDAGRIGDFFKKYGPMYVESQILGGDVFYVYNYKINSIRYDKRTNFERNIAHNIRYLFGLDPTNTLSNQDKQLINNSVEKYMIESNIIGFTPNLINSRAQVNGEVSRIQNYISANPVNAAAVEMELRPYSNLYGFQGLTNAYNKEIKCYTDWEGWSQLKAKVEFVHRSTSNANLRQRAANAIQQANQQIANSLNCNNSVTPNTNQHNNLLQEYQQELRSLKISSSLVNIGGDTQLFYTGGCHWFYNNTDIYGIMLYKAIPEAVPLYKIVYPQNGHYFYSRTPLNNPNYVDQLAGYVLPHQTDGAVPFMECKVFNSQGCRPGMLPFHRTVSYRSSCNPGSTVTHLGFAFRR